MGMGKSITGSRKCISNFKKKYYYIDPGGISVFIKISSVMYISFVCFIHNLIKEKKPANKLPSTKHGSLGKHVSVCCGQLPSLRGATAHFSYCTHP